ncbi:hypothetical protein [Mucilaginibacter paludis]|uniref:Cupin 2 conserved barrel domain protein n=1 Tax=Mucilaginibacter paludis DSM 18603 TaxID=714943 RepID=H1YGI3_9SPHI|nr:hypothetical protein [Mucilaginibacter paludis]EHQ24535.1 hypothetical protein Mucpa_0339 [Mucilaginibacter paludis DSM 18603]
MRFVFDGFAELLFTGNLKALFFIELQKLNVHNAILEHWHLAYRMNVKEFIESGILEEYCLGGLKAEEQAFVIQMSMLYPEVKDELTRVELFMEQMAIQNAVEVENDDLKGRIMSSLEFKEDKQYDLNNLPEINQESDHRTWLNTVRHLIPNEPAGDMIFKLLRQDKRINQTLVITKIDVPEETHTDILESFLILIGRCKCTIGNDAFEAGAGVWVEIPLYIEHDVKVLTPYVVAVLQHKLIYVPN